VSPVVLVLVERAGARGFVNGATLTPVADTGRIGGLFDVKDGFRIPAPADKVGIFAGFGLSSSVALRLRVGMLSEVNLSGELATRGILDIAVHVEDECEV